MTASSHQNPPPDEGTPPPGADDSPAQATDVTRSYDGLTVEAIAQSAVDQVQVESRVELTRARREHESLVWLRERWTATAALVEGRPLDDQLQAGAVLATLDGSAPSTLPLTMAWDGSIAEPDGEGPGAATLIPCTTSRGGRAVIALTTDERLVLGAQLLAMLHTAETCTRSGCDTPAAVDPVDPDEQAPGPLNGGDVDQDADEVPEYLDGETLRLSQGMPAEDGVR